MKKELWDRMGVLEKEAYIRGNPDWLEQVKSYYNYPYEMDEQEIKKLFKYKRVDIDVEYGEVIGKSAIRLQNLDSIIDDKMHLKVKFKRCRDIFECWGDKLKTLEGCPDYMDGGFFIFYTDIKNLIGSPRVVTGKYQISGCPLLQSLDGLPQEVGGDLIIESKGFVFSENYIRSVCKVGGSIILHKF